MVLVHLLGPESIPNGEIYSAANSREQAGQVFKYAQQLIDAEPFLQRRLKVVPNTKRIVCIENGSFYTALSRESGSKHGLNPSVVIFDELAQVRNRELFDVLDTAMGARESPLFITISTQNNDPSHVLSQLIDDGLSGRDDTTVCHLYAANDDADVLDPAAWNAANPAFGDFVKADWFEAQAEKAAAMPSFETSFRNLHLNQRVSMSSPLISQRTWSACAGDAELESGENIFAALDLSARTDLTALAWVSESDPPRADVSFFKPEALLVDHSERDFGARSRQYEQWSKEGWVIPTAGVTVDYGSVAQKIAELNAVNPIVSLAYDRWRIDDFLRELDRADISAQRGAGDGLCLEPWGQGYVGMGPAIEALEIACLDSSLQHPSNPVLTWNIANAVATTDPAGNRKFDKSMSRLRIDGAVALAMAIGLRAKHRKEVVLGNAYEHRGLRILGV